MRKFIFLFAFLFISYHSFSQYLPVYEQDVRKLHKMMNGFYSSEAQSLRDSDFYDIRLKMVPIWKDREGYWLYVEQAMASSEEKPYRQRVYQLQLKNDTTIESIVYTIQNGDKYFGAWKDARPIESLSIDSLELRKGCSILLHKIDRQTYVGSTHNQDCESNLRGATYATSEVTLYSDQIISWDRGFDDKDKQVWGAVKGGYEFLKTDW